MKGTRAALRYAKATLDLAKEKGLSSEINNDMLLIDKTIDENPDLLSMLKNPIIRSEIKKSALNEIFSENVHTISLDLINLLIENKRLQLLQLVAKEYIKIYDQSKGIEVAHVTTALPLSKGLEKKILAKVQNIVGKEVLLNNIVDPNITGGFILRIGDKQLDSSVSGILDNMLKDFEGDYYYASKL